MSSYSWIIWKFAWNETLSERIWKWKNRSRFSHLFDIKHRILPDFYLCAGSIVIIIFKLKYRLHCFNTIQINDEQNHIKMNVLYHFERFCFFLLIIFWRFTIESLSLNTKMRLFCTQYTQSGTVCMHLFFDDNILLFISFWLHLANVRTVYDSRATWRTKI